MSKDAHYWIGYCTGALVFGAWVVLPIEATWLFRLAVVLTACAATIGAWRLLERLVPWLKTEA